MAINKYGLDVTLFKFKLNAITRDVRYYRPDELANKLENLAALAREHVAKETNCPHGKVIGSHCPACGKVKAA